MPLALLLALASARAGMCDDAPLPRERHLPNGMRLIVQENEPTATVVVCAFVRVTALHELHATGIRQLTQMMIVRGTGCREEMIEAAVRADISVAPDYVELALAAPAESLRPTARLMRRMLFEPELTADGLEFVRERALRSIAAREEVPVQRALDRLRQLIYPGAGAGDASASDPAAVADITLEQVVAFHARHYLPNATTVALSGGVDGAEAMRALSDALQRLLPGALPQQVPEPQAAERREDTLNGARPTAVYAVGGRAVSLSSPLYPAAAVGIAALGAGMDGRLYRALRVERSLAYTIGAEMTPSRTVPTALAWAACDPEDLDETARVIDREIERAMRRPADLQPLRRAKRYLIGRHALRRQRNRQIAHYLCMFELLGGPQGFRRDRQLAGEIAAVDADDVADAMTELFAESRAVRLTGRSAAD